MCIRDRAGSVLQDQAPCKVIVALGPVAFVSPTDQVPQRAEVVCRSSDAVGEQPGAHRKQALGAGGRVRGRHACGAFDLQWVPAHLDAPLVEHAVLVRNRVGVTETVPDIGLFGHDPQGLAFAAAPDQHRDVTRRRRVQLRQTACYQRQVPVEGVEASAGVAELVAIGVIVLLEPPGTDAQDQAPLADVVDGARHVCEQLWVAVGVAGDQRTDLDPLGGFGESPQHRPALEVLALGFAVQRVEMIPVEDDVGPQLLGLGAGAPDVVVRRVLGLQLHAHSGWTRVWCVHGSTTWLLPTTVMPDSVTVKPRARSSSRFTPILAPSGTMTFLSMMARWIVALPPTCTKSSRTLSVTVA